MSPNTTKTNIKREGRQYEVDAETVRADDITGVSTLHGAGYSSGDFVSVLNAGGHANVSTASSTYTAVGASLFELHFQHDHHFPAGVTAGMRFSFEAFPSTDQVDVRLQNTTDTETILEQTGITSNTYVTLGPTAYTPTTTNDEIRILVQFRNADNATSVSITDPKAVYGPQL